MSASMKIKPEEGRTYLMTDGSRLRVWKLRAAVVVAFTTEGMTEAWGRTRFEREIESVLE